MRMTRLVVAAAAMAAVLGVARAQYGDLGDLKIAKPEDKEDVKSTPAPKDAVILFDGKNLDNWAMRNDEQKPAEWDVLEGGVAQAKTGDIVTKEHFDGHFKLHVEFRVPYLPDQKGQGRGNSGVYVQGRYEVQVLDSYGLDSKNNDCGAIYEVAAPLVNACKAPTVWQSYDIEFTAPKCEDGKKTEPARLTVHQNGVLIQDDVKIPVDNTRAGRGGDPCTPGPIMLQYHGAPVQFRNVWLVPGK
jgi:3-keto-disaccharide hydrolase